MIIVIMLPHSFRRDSVCSMLEAQFIYFIYFRHVGVYIFTNTSRVKSRYMYLNLLLTCTLQLSECM